MLYIVPTPLGNLEDMPPRALRALKESAAVYCEDTRRTRNLMSHFGVSTPLLRYNEHDPRSVEDILGRLRSGKAVSLVSDAGLPGISDPGWKIVSLARENKIPVTALPGGAAVTTALAGSGLPADSFVFLGFLPRAAGKQKKALAAAAALEKTIAVYESPYRVVDLLAVAQDALGAETPCVVVRELSKMHEEWLRGTISTVHAELGSRKEILGEFVVMFGPSSDAHDCAQAQSGGQLNDSDSQS
jgi:16S rRNA (cytidine1402-2'-O)-methyltransferase